MCFEPSKLTVMTAKPRWVTVKDPRVTATATSSLMKRRYLAAVEDPKGWESLRNPRDEEMATTIFLMEMTSIQTI